MGGGLMQLVAYGAQDVYLTGNPEITFFKVVYRRHTNFSMESILQTMIGTQGPNGYSTVTLSRTGDLVMGLYMEIKTKYEQIKFSSSRLTGRNRNLLHGIIDYIEVEIGGQKIDRHYGHWMETYVQLTQKNELGVISSINNSKNNNWDYQSICNGTKYQRLTGTGGVSTTRGKSIPFVGEPDTFFVPINFWFCRNPGVALPLIALQYHDVKVNFKFSLLKNVISTVKHDVNVYCDYVYLDTDERRRFSQISHEYLIEQVQFQNHTNTSLTKELNFNHPVKELIWVGRTDQYGSVRPLEVCSNTDCTPRVISSSLQNTSFMPKFQNKPPYKEGQTRYLPEAQHKTSITLNGHERISPRYNKYFTRHQILSHHSGFGGVNHHDSIAVYSFALNPEEHQPSGTCNFSRINNAQLIFHPPNDTTFTITPYIYVYAVNYNVLRIMSGMGGLAYSN